MFTFLVIVTVLVFIALLLASAVKPSHSLHSMSELKRRAKLSASAKAELAREKLLPKMEALFALKTACFLVLTVILLIVTFGWAIGIILSILVAIFYAPISRTKRISRAAGLLYEKLEQKNTQVIKKFPKIFHYLSAKTVQAETRVDSREEFQEIIERSEMALTDIERKSIVSILSFNDKKVSSIMTPRTSIDYIKMGEFLGPLVLDELHALGHSRLPVVNGDLDHVVGILYLRDLLSLDVKRSTTAEKAMDTHVYYVRDNQTLENALAVFLKSRHHMLIVVNARQQTVGLLTIEDTIEALLGRKITKEADAPTDI